MRHGLMLARHQVSIVEVAHMQTCWWWDKLTNRPRGRAWASRPVAQSNPFAQQGDTPLLIQAKYPVLSSMAWSHAFLKPPPPILHPAVAPPFYKKHPAHVSIAAGVLDSKSTWPNRAPNRSNQIGTYHRRRHLQRAKQAYVSMVEAREDDEESPVDPIEHAHAFSSPCSRSM
jgi:hypothetical protein